mmetsp:Transcript_18847/g.60891  ORF Transcript_18847/g.60891 Transcript_18847/m.60891 type:complete len:246 (-) Transcript_18847:1638-2375(-)
MHRWERSRSEDVAKRDARATASSRSSILVASGISSRSKTRAVVLAQAVIKRDRDRADPRRRASSAQRASSAWAIDGRSIAEERQPYSPRIHASMCRRASGMSSQSSIAAKVSTADPLRASSSSSSPRCASSSSFSAAPPPPAPSATRATRFCVTSGCKRSPASSMTRMTVATYHSFDGAKRSAATESLETRSALRNSSFVDSKLASNFDAMNSTFTGLIIRYSKSRVFRFRVSSPSSRHSMTANW